MGLVRMGVCGGGGRLKWGAGLSGISLRVRKSRLWGRCTSYIPTKTRVSKDLANLTY
jgi:hypothetical protein